MDGPVTLTTVTAADWAARTHCCWLDTVDILPLQSFSDVIPTRSGHTVCPCDKMSASTSIYNILIDDVPIPADPGLQLRGATWRAREREPIIGALMLCPQMDPGAKPLVREWGGKAPETETILTFIGYA